MKKRKPQTNTKFGEYPIRRGITFKSPGPYYGGGTFFYFDKNGRFVISLKSVKKSQVMTDLNFAKKFGVKVIQPKKV